MSKDEIGFLFYSLFLDVPPIVKVRFQSPQIAHRYKSTLHALTTILREERFIGLYKGISSPMVHHDSVIRRLFLIFFFLSFFLDVILLNYFLGLVSTSDLAGYLCVYERPRFRFVPILHEGSIGTRERCPIL